MTVRVALSGCGAVAKLYYRGALAELERNGVLRLVAAFDPDSQAAANVCAGFPGANPARDFGDILDLAPDLVVVASPPRVHATQTIAALRSGASVLCEKPLALTADDAEQMVQEAERSSRMLAAAMVRRHLPAARAVGAMLRSGAIGRLRQVDIFEGGPFDWPVHSAAFFDAAEGCGILEDIGPHVVDLLRWWLGEPDSLTYCDDAMGGVAANCLMTLGFGEAQASVRLSRDWYRPNIYRFTGGAGWIEWHADEADGFAFGFDGPDEERHWVRCSPAATGLQDAFSHQLRDVIHAVGSGTPPQVSGKDALPTVRLLDRCRAQRTEMAMPWLA